MTFFSVELTSLQLKGVTNPSDDQLLKQPQLQQQQQQTILLDYQFLNDDNSTNDQYSDNNTEDNNETAITFKHEPNNNETMITDDSHNNTKSLHLQISQGRISNTIPITQIHDAIHQRNQQYLKAKDANALPLSPACYPHFNHYSTNTNNNNGQLSFSWNNNTKFKRILFYHARKAGGSSMNKYLVKVAQHYNIHLEWIEWNTMEEPGLLQHHFDKPDTFYVTHVREPIERSISHFKYNGRWPCKTMLKREFVPTPENALELESWNETQGHVPKKQCHYNRKENTTAFYLGDCAVNCYIQWFGGLSCPRWKVPMEQQYEVAMSKLLKYNLIIVIDKLRDPRYVEAMEQFFGVRGILERGKPFCERMSHKANEEHPLVVREETKARLIELNRLDLKLYHEITDCLEDGDYYEHIPKWDGSRFQLDSYNWTEAQIEKDRAKALRKEKRKKKNGQREE